MTSQYYRNTIFAVYLLFCLLATSWSAPSFIRQSTDDFIQQISSQDSKISASKAVTGLRNYPPVSYTIRMESFPLVQSTTEIYKSRPFSVGGYNWTLVIYPKGNTKDGGSGYLSLYLAIDNSSSVTNVLADVRFYIFNFKEKMYFTIQDTDIWRFSDIKRMWGFSQVLPLDDTFKNEYLTDRDICEFGVDVTFPSRSYRLEFFTVNNNFHNPRFTWNITRFSTLSRLYYQSHVFIIANKRWRILVYPNGVDEGAGRYLALSLHTDNNFQTNEKMYVRGKFRVINQLHQFSHYERPIEHWYDIFAYHSTNVEYMPLSDLNDPSKGFIVNDTLMVQVELEAISSTIYFS